MKTKVVPYASCVSAPNFNCKLKWGTEIFVNKLPWDWHVHVRVNFDCESSEYVMYIFNAEMPDGKYNPNIDDLHQLLWYQESSPDLEKFKNKFKELNVEAPEGFWEEVRLYKDTKCVGKNEFTSED